MFIMSQSAYLSRQCIILWLAAWMVSTGQANVAQGRKQLVDLCCNFGKQMAQEQILSLITLNASQQVLHMPSGLFANTSVYQHHCSALNYSSSERLQNRVSRLVDLKTECNQQIGTCCMAEMAACQSSIVNSLYRIPLTKLQRGQTQDHLPNAITIQLNTSEKCSKICDFGVQAVIENRSCDHHLYLNDQLFGMCCRIGQQIHQKKIILQPDVDTVSDNDDSKSNQGLIISIEQESGNTVPAPEMVAWTNNATTPPLASVDHHGQPDKRPDHDKDLTSLEIEFGGNSAVIDQNNSGAQHAVLSKQQDITREPQSTCATGYQWNVQRRVCEDIDECSVDAEHAVCDHQCRNLDGSYECLCPAGYDLVAGECMDIDECAEAGTVCHLDDQQHLCINLVGQYRCADIRCPPDYTKVYGSSCITTQLAQTQQAHNVSVYVFDSIGIASLSVPETGLRLFTFTLVSSQSAVEFRGIWKCQECGQPATSDYLPIDVIAEHHSDLQPVHNQTLFQIQIDREHETGAIVLKQNLHGPQTYRVEVDTIIHSENAIGRAIFYLFVSPNKF